MTAVVETMRNQTPPPSPILHLSFNQDGDCFAVGTSDGFVAFQTDPFAKTLRSNFSKYGCGGGGSGIGIVEMLFRTNRFALVGGGAAPKFPRNQVVIWDNRLRRCIGELVFRSEVRSVRLSHDRIVVVTLQKICVYNFEDLRLLHEILTESNPKGLCEISKSGFMVLASLGLRKGQVSVNHFARRRENFIMAHDSSIACLSLTNDGKILATASVKGTLIRVFNSLDGSLLHELRRGVERAEIYSLCFSSTAEWLAVSSDRGTIHVFSIKVDLRSLKLTGLQRVEYQDLSPAPDSRLSLIKGMFPKYFSSEWSFAQFRVKEGLQHIANFGKQKNTLDIVGFDGRFYRCEFDPVIGGKMIQLECHNFFPQESK